MPIENKFLLNFAASYSTGGYKRLYEYAKWFNANGGAWFVVHHRCANLVAEFPNNRFFVVRQSRYDRLFNDCAYLRMIEKEIGEPDLYYSYGIPLYSKFGKVTWFHLSNVLPLGSKGSSLGSFERLKASLLGMKIRAGFAHADVISAESASSLKILGGEKSERLFLSVNGSDDEIAFLGSKGSPHRENTATVVGTAPYKALQDSHGVFEMLKQANPGLKLVIIGDPRHVPAVFSGGSDVVILGIMQRSDVIECLREARFYISTTRIENSYNAAAEGIFFAEESYISNIGPHQELLLNERFNEVSIPGIDRTLLKVGRQDLSGINLKTWDTVIGEMVARCRETLRDF